MKVMKSFKPLPSEDGDEFYPNGVFVFNISKLIQYIDNNREVFQAEQVTVNALQSFRSPNLNEATVNEADLSVPIIMAEISPDQFNVIDGHHRLEKARREGVEVVLAYKVPVEHHIFFLNSIDGYLAYVEYWNNKLKERKKYNAV
jgi:hypothetical protein